MRKGTQEMFLFSFWERVAVKWLDKERKSDSEEL